MKQKRQKATTNVRIYESTRKDIADIVEACGQNQPWWIEEGIKLLKEKLKKSL